MWRINDKGEKEYVGGKKDWAVIARIAAACPAFEPDDEDEMVAEEVISCYNCRYRRWTAESFTCYKAN